LFWNDKQIWTIKLDCQFREKDIDFTVAPDDKAKFITDVRSGSNPKHIAIIVHQSSSSNCIVTWNIEKNLEKSAFDVPK